MPNDLRDAVARLLGYSLPPHVEIQTGEGTDAPAAIFADADYEVGDGKCGLHESAKSANEPCIVYLRADAALSAMSGARVKPLEWEDCPREDGPVLSKAVSLHGTYFIVDDTDDFTGLYLQLISHDEAKWWEHVRSTCETLKENIHDENMDPIKAIAEADNQRRIFSALTPTAPSVQEAARVLIPWFEGQHKAWAHSRGRNPEDYVSHHTAAADALRAIAEGGE